MNKLIVEIDDSDLFQELGVYKARTNISKKEVITKLLGWFLRNEPHKLPPA